MHIGISRPTVPDHPIPDIDGGFVAQVAERLGFEMICYGEHPVRLLAPDGGALAYNAVHTDGIPRFQDLVVMLSRASAMTERIRIGSAVCLVIAHYPLMLAKQLACIDHYSGGRLTLGIGAGGSMAEIEGMGGDPRRPWAQTGEAVKLMRQLWSQDMAQMQGEFYSVPPVQSYPRPVQQPSPPILLGARGPRAFARIVDYCDGWMPAFISPEDIEQGPWEIERGVVRIREEADRAGKDAAAFTVTAILRGDVDRDVVRRYEDVGIERVLVSLPRINRRADVEPELAKIAEVIF
jgi:probable F420-dependent oxidoreductase